MTLTLDPQLEQRIQREIDLGHYGDPSEVIAHALSLLPAGQGVGEEDAAAIRAQLQRLTTEWRRDTLFLSSDTDVVLHPAYQRIIGMGKPAIPFILHDLIQNGGNWFWALAAITGENPVNPDDAGKTKKMKEAWQQWGLANHYLTRS